MGAQVHVFESDVTIPKFAVFKLLDEIDSLPKGHVTFSVKESNDRFGSWFDGSFLLDNRIMVRLLMDLSSCFDFIFLILYSQQMRSIGLGLDRFARRQADS